MGLKRVGHDWATSTFNFFQITPEGVRLLSLEVWFRPHLSKPLSFSFCLFRPFLKSLLNLLQYCFCFMFGVFGQEACGILAPQGLNLYILHWKMKSLPLDCQGGPSKSHSSNQQRCVQPSGAVLPQKNYSNKFHMWCRKHAITTPGKPHDPPTSRPAHPTQEIETWAQWSIQTLSWKYHVLGQYYRVFRHSSQASSHQIITTLWHAPWPWKNSQIPHFKVLIL